MSQSSSLSSLAARKFRKNSLGMAGLLFILVCGIIAIFAYVLAPDNSSNANQMHLEIHSKRPGFKVLLFKPSHKEKQTQNTINQWFFGKKMTQKEIAISSYKIKNDTIIITPFSENKAVTLSKKYPVPQIHLTKDISKYITEKTFYLGTDRYGRDLLSRMLIGTRISFFIGFIAVFISLLIGIIMGATAGYFGGKIDAFIMWIINITWSIPTLLLVIAITLALGKGFWQVFIAVGLTMWVEVARVVRGQIISAKHQQYAEAAKALGFSHFRIIFKHILPNIMAPIIVISAANFAAAILIESGLSFLGVGAQPPVPSWGSIIKNHYNYIIVGKAYLALIPGVAIMSLVMAFMLVGNALREALDVKN